MLEREPIRDSRAPLFAFWAQAMARLWPAETGAERDYLTRLPQATENRATLLAALKQPLPEDRLAADLYRTLNLDLDEALCCVLLLQVEKDPQLPAIIGRLQHPYGGVRPGIGLMQRLLAGVSKQPEALLGRLRRGALSEAGALLWQDDPELPLIQQAPRLHPDLIMAEQDNAAWPGAHAIEGIDLPASLAEAVHAQASALRGVARATLVLRGADGEEARAVAGEIARRLMRKPVWLPESNRIDPALGVWCEMTGHLPVLAVEAVPGERVMLPALPGYSGPLLVVSGPEGRFERRDAIVDSWVLPRPDSRERGEVWREHLKHEDAAALGERYRVGALRIQSMARAAQRRAKLAQRDVDDTDLRAAAWGDKQALAGLAQPVTAEVPDRALVLRPGTHGELQDLECRCRRRDALADGLGVTVQTRYQPGVRALFVGPSGTGKTLAAAWLATRLGLPLYRVDSAAVSSKYIGETEKNLSRLLAEAEAQDVVLLFDEADALFGKRTDIKDSNDRFANAQTNYLLQRIESYDGIVILTGNSRQRLDSAFTRRLDVILEFPAPGPEERRDLWLSHLGEKHCLQARQLNMLAGSCDLSGGHIRNVVLNAAVRAGEAAIDFDTLCYAVAAEYKKQGKPVPSEIRQQLGSDGSPRRSSA